MHLPKHGVAETTPFVTPAVGDWLKPERAVWVRRERFISASIDVQ